VVGKNNLAKSLARHQTTTAEIYHLLRLLE